MLLNKTNQKKEGKEGEKGRFEGLAYLLELLREHWDREYRVLTCALDGVKDKFEKGLIRFSEPLSILSEFSVILVVPSLIFGLFFIVFLLAFYVFNLRG